jgi:hypothetical protein
MTLVLHDGAVELLDTRLSRRSGLPQSLNSIFGLPLVLQARIKEIKS